ncbi:MAG: nucleotidyl transferase AbiEii/AbiGii toxin family protein [Gemmatimonadota bacterium]|nr:nucleotidyl transferase AbiEii/AbiGii toxin family protein [Gemmatimonadota bacterium]
MDVFANRRPRDRADVFLTSAAQRGIERASIIEKDFWVCWTLTRIFSDIALGRADPDDAAGAPIVFKGGTSLSKAYAAIERFSEDIDLTVNRQLLGFSGQQSDPAAQPSHGKATALLKAISEAGRNYVSGPFLDALRQSIATALTEDAAWSIEPDPEDRATLVFHYPRALPPEEYDSYVAPAVRLECGARGDVWPSVAKTIRSYVAEDFPELFNEADVVVDVLDAERTFWEKATLLHEIAHRADTDPPVLPAPRLSRHYYDLARLADQPIGVGALTRVDLLSAVAAHKAAFFPRKAAHFELATPGTLRLLPSSDAMEQLRTDYAAMRPMFFADPPSFEFVTDRLRRLESSINALPPQW